MRREVIAFTTVAAQVLDLSVHDAPVPHAVLAITIRALVPVPPDSLLLLGTLGRRPLQRLLGHAAERRQRRLDGHGRRLDGHLGRDGRG